MASFQPAQVEIQDARMTKFMLKVNQKHTLELKDYHELYRWSVDNFRDFWLMVWHEMAILHEGPAPTDGKDVLTEYAKMSDLPRWFPLVQLNYAENLLWQWRHSDQVALIGTNESRQWTSKVTYK